MIDTSLNGHCFCGAVHYRCGALLYPATLCHCESCRRIAGAHAVGWITVAKNSFAYVQGKPARFSSSSGVVRTFCGDCGTPLTYYNRSRPTEIDITLVSLESAVSIAPADHIWMMDALPWDEPHDGRPQHQKTREIP